MDFLKVYVSDQRNASIGELETTVAATSSRSTQRAAWRHIPEDAILHNHRREHLKSYIALTGWIL
jgi:hypothetical protein